MNISQHWRLKTQRYLLQGQQTEDGSVSFPPRPQVPQRHAEHFEFEQPVVVEDAKPLSYVA